MATADAGTGRDGRGPRVPLSNLFYLLCYATNRLEVMGQVDVSAVEGSAPVQLYAGVLDAFAARLRRRGVQRLYRSFHDDTSAPRGRILLAPSISRGLLWRRRVCCEIDEMTPDVPFNRVLKAALRRLAGHPRVALAVRRRLRAHIRALGGIADIAPTARDVAAARAARLDGVSSFALHVCEIVLEDLLIRPDGDAASRRLAFDDWDGTPQAMGGVFESFVLHFLRREQARFRATKLAAIPWQVSASPMDRGLLPQMEGDVLLSAPDRRILIETKFYSRTLHRNRGGAPKVRSGHLYQLSTYLTHLAGDGRPRPTGVLLYAQVERPLALRYELAGHVLHVRSLNLSQPAARIHDDLLALVDDVADDRGAGAATAG